ncbi:MAG: 2-hydroxyacyl-CoA dehydratase family protein [Pseudomonadota bacterium]
MEEELQNLLNLNQGANRTRYVSELKKDGRKVVGLLCSYIPEEIVHAAGLVPWRIMGTQRAGTPRADVYRPPHTCAFCNHVLESLLSGDFDFLDAVVATSWDQDLVRLWDVWTYLGKTPHTYIMHLPLDKTQTHRKQFTKEVRKLLGFVEDLAGREIKAEELCNSIGLYNRVRSLLHRLYELRKREKPPLSGSEMLGLTLAGLLMPVEEFLRKLEALMPYLEKRECRVQNYRPRLLVSSDRLDNPDFLKVVEETGCLVAMDDLDAASRHFWEYVRTEPSSSKEGLVAALAQRYHSQPASPGMMTWSDQVAQVAAWVKEFDIQGVLELKLMYSWSRQMRARYLRDRLTALGIPVASFEREYHLAGVGQLKTRVGAFVEMLE